MKTLLPEVKEKLWEDHKIEVSIETLEKYLESLPTWLLRAIRADYELLGNYAALSLSNSGIELFAPKKQEQINRICYLITHKW
jgi:hypothetical protein